MSDLKQLIDALRSCAKVYQDAGSGSEYSYLMCSDAADALQAQEWQPIETAPKGVLLRVSCRGMVKRAILSEALGFWYSLEGRRLRLIPTYWKPLDQPPEDV